MESSGTLKLKMIKVKQVAPSPNLMVLTQDPPNRNHPEECNIVEESLMQNWGMWETEERKSKDRMLGLYAFKETDQMADQNCKKRLRRDKIVILLSLFPPSLLHQLCQPSSQSNNWTQRKNIHQ